MNENRQELKILVIDDEKLVRMATCAKLRRAGYECVAFGDVESAIAAIQESPQAFCAVISDISMGGIDGFAFRDIVRGIKATIPIFFLTAMDPEEGSGFLQKILADPISFYLPKSVSTDVLVKRLKQIVASRRVSMFIERKMDEDKKSLSLAANIQRSLLPSRALMTDRAFYTALWSPVEIVSGDLFDAIPIGRESYLYMLGDIQGHGTGAALAMTAVQSFLNQFTHSVNVLSVGVAGMANMLHRFFRTNLTDVSYMTMLICIHRVEDSEVEWISCGAPDLQVVENGKAVNVNPEKRGGLPIGLMPDTVYGPADVVRTKLSPTAFCVGFTDGIYDVSRDADGVEVLPANLMCELRDAGVSEMRKSGSIMVAPAKFMDACRQYGYDNFHDDVTAIAFGPRVFLDGIYEETVPLVPEAIDNASQAMAEWCRAEGWGAATTNLVQLVLEEKLMNVHDHGFEDRDRLRETASIRLRRCGDKAELTVWDYGSPEPSIQVAAGDAATNFENANRAFSNHGRGRLMIREICDSVERERLFELNTTKYYIPVRDDPPEEEES